MKFRQTLLATAIGLLALQPPAQGADMPRLDYAVVMTAPETQRELLQSHLDLYRWRDSERMDEGQLRRLVDQAPEQIRDLLATEGYYSPEVEAVLTAPRSVRLTVAPGEPTLVADVDLRLQGPAADAAERLARIRSEWGLPPGRVFRHEDWEKAKRTALGNLLLDRYPAATLVRSQATVDPVKRSVALGLVLDSGPAFSFGPLAIQGLSRYPAAVVEHLNPIRPGEPYSQAKLLEFQSRLQATPYFASANVRVDPDPAHPEQVPIQVEVRENRAHTLGLGIGASTDTGPRAQVDYQAHNLMGKALRLSTTLKLAKKEQGLVAEVQLPPGLRGVQDSLNAGFARVDVAGEVTHTLTLGARRNRSQGKNEVSYGLRLYQERQDVAGAIGDRRSALVPSWSLTRRDVDHLLFPTRGYIVNVQADVAAQALLSDQSFVRGYGKAVWFHPLGKGQLILRGELGIVAADDRDGIPSDFLFRTGGDQSVRGYAYQSLGVAEGNAVVGGRWLVTAGAEYVHWLSPNWGAAVFVDGGDAAANLDDLDSVLGYGLGARWKSPIGPLSLDLARGHDTGRTRLHFSVGYSF